MKRSRVATLGIPALFALGLSCTTQPVVLPSRDFNRPTDVTFVCMGAFEETTAAAAVDAGDAGVDNDARARGQQVLTGRPMRACHPRGMLDPVASQTNRTFAFLPNSASGDLSVVDTDNWKLVNLDPANFGYNALPLGVLPTQIAASDDGCRVVTANHGSCDLSLVDPAALLAPTFAREYAGVSTSAANPIVSTTVVPRTSAGVPLRLLPGEVSFLPRGTAQLPAQVCGGAWTWQALVTFPSCDLVALLDMPSGVIKKAAYVRRTEGNDGVVLVPLADGAAPVCPITDCTAVGVPAAGSGSTSDGGAGASEAGSGEAGASEAGITDAGRSEAGVSDAGVSDAGISDAGVSDAGATDAADAGPPAPTPSSMTLPPLGVGPLAIVPETGRAYVGMANSPFVVAFDVATNSLSTAGSRSISLENAVGVNRLRLSIDPYLDKTSGTGSSGISGTFIGDGKDQNREYLYVITRDGTLRVVEVAPSAQPTEIECETNFDPLSVTDATARAAILSSACISIDPKTHPRRPFVIGPGIQLPTPPIDVAVANISPMPVDPSETSVSGTHAWAITASGAVYLINIDPVARNIAYVEPGVDATATTSRGLPLVHPCLTPTGDCFPENKVFGYPPPPNTLRNRNVLSYTVALDPSEGLPRLDVPSSESSIGPRIESVWTTGSADNETALSTDYLQTEVFFHDLTSVTPQTWTVTWQGPLMANPRPTGELQDMGATLEDFGANFCRLGVQPTDLLTLDGCTQNSQCGLGKVCVVGTEGTQAAGGLPITGLCLAPGTEESTCDSVLSTLRRYDITAVGLTALGIAPHKDELVRPSIKPCVAKANVKMPDGGADAHPMDAGASADANATDADAGADAGNLAPLIPESDCVDPSDPSTADFQCVEGRCLIPCKKVDSYVGCRAGRICVSFGSSGNFCADGPDLTPPKDKSTKSVDLTDCLGELLPYQLNAGRSYVVAGSQTGIPVTQTSLTNSQGVTSCVPVSTVDPTADPMRIASRISLDAPHCSNVADDRYDTRCDPNVAMSCPDLSALRNLVATQASTSAPNPCLFVGGPNVTDQPGQSPEHIRALFRNRELQFMMTNLEQPPSSVLQIRFDVHGGFLPQTVTIPSTVEVTMPARIVLGPFDSNAQTGPVTDTAEIPYLFVVDQRRLGRSQGGGPTRGQLLRIHPRGLPITEPVTGSQPWFEDLTHSNNLFPIQ